MTQRNPIDLYIGQKLYKIRQQAGRSRTDVAAAIGVQPKQIREFETGAERVPAAVLLRLSKLFLFDVHEFFRGLSTTEQAPAASSAMMSETRT